jgi:hypothetical protein
MESGRIAQLRRQVKSGRLPPLCAANLNSPLPPFENREGRANPSVLSETLILGGAALPVLHHERATEGWVFPCLSSTWTFKNKRTALCCF